MSLARSRDSDGESEIDIHRCGPALCGAIVWLKQPRTDAANPDPALRERSLLGMRVLSGFKPDPASAILSGVGYNPADGRSYKTTVGAEIEDHAFGQGLRAGRVHMR